MKRYAVVALVGLGLVLGACGRSATTEHSTGASQSPAARTTSTSEDDYLAALRSYGIVPTYGNADTAVKLGHAICDAVDTDGVAGLDSYAEAGLQTEIPPAQVGRVIGASVRYLCPENLPVVETWVHQGGVTT